MRSLGVCFTVLFVSLVLGYAQDEADTDASLPSGVTTCGVGHDAQTAHLRGAADFTVVLKMQSDDDHFKHSHLCMAHYTLEITRPDGSSKSFQILDSDDEWGRPLTFRVEGFSSDGRLVLVSLIEGNYPESLRAIEFDMSTGRSGKSVILGRPFTGRLSRDCARSLHIVGTSPAGYLVLGTEEKDGCIRGERWQLSHNKNVVQHGAPAEVANNHPARLSPHTTAAKLETGILVEP
jgi:hypothetical protein